MRVLITDAAFRREVPKVANSDRHELWRNLHEVGCFFAVFGAMEEALSIWRFMYSGLVSMPDPDDRTISVFGDGAISAACYKMNLDDVSNGVPAPSFAGRDHKHRLAGGLTARVLELDRICRERITSRMSCGTDPTLIEPDAIRVFRQARLLASPAVGEDHSVTEQAGYSLLSDLLDNDQAIGTLRGYMQAEAFLLAADIAARIGKPEDAIRYLQKWYDCSFKWDYSLGEVLGLIPVAGLIFDGALAKKSKMSANERQQIAKTLIAELSARLQQPESSFPPKLKHKVYISHAQFYLEHRKPNSDKYFQEEIEITQGFSSFHYNMAICTPDDAEYCVVQVEFGTSVPEIESAVQAVAAPLSIEPSGELFIRTVAGAKQYRLEIPVGAYDVVVRFFPIKRKNSQDFSAWNAVLTFLPSGTVGPKCFKLLFGSPPAELLLHPGI